MNITSAIASIKRALAVYVTHSNENPYSLIFVHCSQYETEKKETTCESIATTIVIACVEYIACNVAAY